MTSFSAAAAAAEAAMKLTWDDAEEIGILLGEAHPGIDPLTVRFTDLHRWVTVLDGFEGDPGASSEGKLEAIQMAWLEEYRDSQD
jgi:FeS assembly protein IscX